MKSTTFRKTALMTSTLALTAGLALSAGSAMASLPTLISPLGISSSAGTTDQHMAVASFP
jgi:hypothetical protein